MRQDLLPQTTDLKLAHVEEEIGEVIQAMGKLRRFGEHAQDHITKIKYDNLADLHEEMRQLKVAIDRYLKDFL